MVGPLVLDGSHLTIEDALSVARRGRAVELAPGVAGQMARARSAVEKAVHDGRPVYGVTTGFGRLSDRTVPREELLALQRNLVRSHASGVGDLLPSDVVRTMLLVRANGLARGHSGVRREVVQSLLDLLNHGIVPAVPAQGSVGASGDLAPLAHAALALVGEGEVLDGAGKTRPARAALTDAGLRPLELEEKEGISLLNGTCLMASYLTLLVHDGEKLARAAALAAAVSFDALKGNLGALDARLQDARNLPVQAEVASTLRQLLSGSGLARAPGEYQGQDPYVLRCLPQVFAASWTGIRWAEGIARGELNASSDNPLVLDGEFVSGGNFHGQPLALALDTLTLALSYLGGFAERRVARLVDFDLSRGLSPFLSSSPGLLSGYMIPPYVAASLVAENQGLVHPASAFSLPTSANQEDYNSMGATAGAQGMRLLENVRRIVAIELLVACQALEQRRPAHGGRGTEATWEAVRRRVPPLTDDRSPAPDIERLAGAVRDESLVREVESALGGKD
jgi:histidine ammonia-lyase